LIGFGDIGGLPAEVRGGLPVGVSVAMKYPRETIRGIAELPTAAYYEQYGILNERLDALVAFGAAFLQARGYQAIAQTREYAGNGEKIDSTLLPHKTIATRAGIGWIGKCALLVTKEFGSMIRLSSILTDAPFETAAPVDQSDCGDCMICRDACPGGAVSGKLWSLGLYRDAFFDIAACRKTARERSIRGFGEDASVCGKCIEVCPYTQRYLKGES
jgi:epoxyqueuosine reductase QueG